MLIRSRKPSDLRESDVTDHQAWLNRRQFVKASGAFAASAMVWSQGYSPQVQAQANLSRERMAAKLAEGFAGRLPNTMSIDEKVTPQRDFLRYNNFYEFGTDKDDPEKYADALTVDPWSIKVDGETARPGSYALEDLVQPHRLEERIYRLRCVEAWSMVVPWVGIPLSAVIKALEPTSEARYVMFETLVRPEEMRGQRSVFSSIQWPYQEGLRMDEALHPLSLLAVGAYGEFIANQNGAPIRLVVPWKYGFKSIKSIVRISFVREQPPTSWNDLQPREYGFYANVNPAVDHPRWSQKTERRLPGGLFGARKIPTLPFNGYAEEVASLYAGMDLTRFF